MKDEAIKRDPELGALLARVSGEAPLDEVDWEALRRRTVERASAGTVKSITLRRRVRAFLGTAMAASVALLFMVTRSGDEGNGGSMFGGDPTLEEILTSDVSDAELRALLAGAGGVEALLLLAASEDER